MDQRSLEQLLRKQKTSVERLLATPCFTRDAACKIVAQEDILIIEGVRGSGKTFSTVHALSSSDKTFAYVDLSDSSLYYLHSTDFSGLVEGLLMVYGATDCVVLDEFTAHAGWKKCFEVFWQRGIHIIGISSVELTQEDMPHGSRVLKFHPLSFKEYCRWHNIDTDISTLEKKIDVRTAYDDYQVRGGFPALQNLVRPKIAARNLTETIFKEDIRGDFRKGSIPQIRSLASYLLEQSAKLINYKKLAETFEIKSEVTVKKFIESIKRSGCFDELMRFALFDKSRNVYEKLYVADPALVTVDDIAVRMETVVYLQLLRFCQLSGYRMHYYANRTTECNFALCINMKMRTLIQVIANYRDSASIKEKVNGLISLSKATDCDKLYILTYSAHDHIVEKGLSIEIMPIYEFLLDPRVNLSYQNPKVITYDHPFQGMEGCKVCEE